LVYIFITYFFLKIKTKFWLFYHLFMF